MAMFSLLSDSELVFIVNNKATTATVKAMALELQNYRKIHGPLGVSYLTYKTLLADQLLDIGITCFGSSAKEHSHEKLQQMLSAHAFENDWDRNSFRARVVLAAKEVINELSYIPHDYEGVDP